MKHGKLIGLQTDIERLARVAVAAYDAATAPQTAPSGSISLDNADGTRTIIGPQAGSGDGAPSGQAMATHVGDTTPPPVPTGITAWSGDGSLHVMWDGTLSGDVPADFDHISILVDGEEVAQLSSAGSVTVGGVEAGATVSVTATAEDDACLADGTPAHNVSAPSAAVKVTIKDAVAEVRADADAHGEQIDAVKQDIAAYKASAEATYATKTEVDERTGAITRTLAADYTKTVDLAATEAVKDAKAAGTAAQSQLAGYKKTNDQAVAAAKKSGDDAAVALDSYKGVVSETYAEKTELTEAVNQLSSTMSSNYSAFTDYRTSNDQALSKAQSDATDAQSAIDSYKASNDRAVADAKAAGTTAQDQLNSYKSSNDQAVAAARKAGTDAQSNLDSYRGTTDQRLDELKNIADNAIESWYLKGAPTTSNAPAKDWTTDALRKQHAGDLYMDTETGYSYRWSGTEWVQVKDSDVTKALKEIESVKTTYATKSELKATDTELSGKVSDSLTTAKSYTDSSVEQEVTARNAAIKAQADSISLDVSRTYTKSETFSAYQSDADGRIATANSNASTAKSTAQTAASDAATAKTTATSAANTASNASKTAQDAKKTADGISVGGRNLVLGTGVAATWTAPTIAAGSFRTWDPYNMVAAWSAIGVKAGDPLTLTFDWAVTGAPAGATFKVGTDTRPWEFFDLVVTLAAGSSSGHVSTTVTAPTPLPTSTGSKFRVRIDAVGNAIAAGMTVTLSHVKIERGNKATDYSPAPEDVDAAIGTAQDTANAANNTANSAKSTATAAQAKADDAWARTLRVEVMSAPADAAGDTSTLTATVWRGGELLSDEAVAKMGLLAWYVGGKRVATGNTYTCKAGTAAECRLEA